MLDSTEKQLLPDDKIQHVVDLIEAGSEESINEINKLIEIYKFSNKKLAEILRLAPLTKLFNIDMKILHPKVFVRVLACCVNVINMSSDEELIKKCQRILDFACDRLYYINFDHDEMVELAEINYDRLTEFVVNVSNDYKLQAKIMITEEKAKQISEIIKSGDENNIKILNKMIGEYRFSHNNIAFILKKAPIKALEKLNTDIIHPKIIIRVIACCVKEIKWNKDNIFNDKFKQIYEYAYNELKKMKLNKDDYLELAKIADVNILKLANLSDDKEVKQAVIDTAELTDLSI